MFWYHDEQTNNIRSFMWIWSASTYLKLLWIDVVRYRGGKPACMLLESWLLASLLPADILPCMHCVMASILEMHVADIRMILPCMQQVYTCCTIGSSCRQAIQQ